MIWFLMCRDSYVPGFLTLSLASCDGTDSSHRPCPAAPQGGQHSARLAIATISAPSCAGWSNEAAVPHIPLPAEQTCCLPYPEDASGHCGWPAAGQSHPVLRMASGTQASSLELQGEAHKECCPRVGLWVQVPRGPPDGRSAMCMMLMPDHGESLTLDACTPQSWTVA